MADLRGRELAGALVRLPLRWSDVDQGADGGTVIGRRYLKGAAEGGRLLAAAMGGRVEPWCGYGGDWPVVSCDDLLAAPAVPALLPFGTTEGADAAYRRTAHGIWREAGGTERLLLCRDGDRAAAPGRPFDLLWFGPCEQWVLRGGSLEIVDLFAELHLPSSPEILDRWLLRACRVEAAILEGLDLDGPAAPAEITVRRQAALSRTERWKEPDRFLALRADIARVATEGTTTTAAMHGGDRIVFTHQVVTGGWQLRLVSGSYPFTELMLIREGDMLVLRGIIAGALDPLEPGVRARLAFDLRSDLVTAGQNS